MWRQRIKNLGQRGIDVYFPTDRFVDKLINHNTDAVLIGSAPIKNDNGVAIIGNQSIEIEIGESIVVQDTSHNYYPLQYYDTPFRYFRELEKISGLDLNLDFVKISDINQAYKVIERAEEIDSNIIAIRISYEEEYVEVRDWLNQNENNRVILFHSVVYDPGFRLFEEFPEQTSFGDTKPIFI